MFVKHGACGAQQENLGHPVKVLQTIFHVFVFYLILRKPAFLNKYGIGRRFSFGGSRFRRVKMSLLGAWSNW